MAVAAAWPARAQDLPEMSVSEVLIDRSGGGTLLRFRLIVPRIDPARDDALSFAEVEPLFERLCREMALPYIAEHGLAADAVVISLADRFVEFGATDPAATQYFDQFALKNGDCIWEAF